MSEPMLGRAVDPSEYGTLDTFPVERPVRVRFETAELEALCPAVEGIQPDIYRCVIEFRAETVSLESKSLKYWLVTFRDRRIFAENLAAEIGTTISAVEGLTFQRVTLTQNIRGGLVETVTYEEQPS
jgi:7-cyano-7-deazaguanine reductase